MTGYLPIYPLILSHTALEMREGSSAEKEIDFNDSLSARMQRARAPRFRMIRNLHFVRGNQ